MLYLLFLLFTVWSGSSAFDIEKRQLQIINQSGEQVSVEWINPKSGQSVALGAPTNGGEVLLYSYVDHTLVIRADDGGNSTFQVTDDKNQVIVVGEGLTLINDTSAMASQREDNLADEQSRISTRCHRRAMENKDSLPPQSVLELLTECLTSETALLIEEKNELLAQERRMRLDVSMAVENYTCTDPLRETSKPIEVTQWINKGIEREVHILHSRQSSQIHMIKDFISNEECEAITRAAAKSLHRGTVADGKGGSRMSENRKAWQAGVAHNWDVDGDPINAVSRRLFDYTNEITGYNMSYDGQEDLMSIQYFGNGTEDKTPDRYMPHCDGDCDGLPHKTGGRVATMVMYCDVPELGGGTNFQNANVFVKPAKGAAAFFSYLDPITYKKELGFTTHSGCPVYKGSKRIAVQWMRVGVDRENPWDSFDTNTMSKKLARELNQEEGEDYAEDEQCH